MNNSDTRDSDQVFDFYCEQCNWDGQHLAAEGYCRNCEIFLCRECVNCHHRPIQMRHHVLLDEKQMPKDKLSTPNVSKCNEKCHEHPTEIVQMYCKLHAQIGCHKCMSAYHYLCADVNYIPTIANGIGDSQEYISFLERLESLEKYFKSIKSTSESNLTEVDKNYHEVLRDIEIFRKDINLYLDNLETKLHSETTELANDKRASMNLILKSCDDSTEKINMVRLQIEKMKNNNRDVEVFMMMVNEKAQIKCLDDLLRDLQTNNSVSPFIFAREEHLINSYEGIIRLGKVMDLPIQRRIDIRNSMLIMEFNDRCDIIGISELVEEYIACINWSSSWIRVYKTATKQVAAEQKIAHHPACITKVSDRTIAVGLPDITESKILIMSVNFTDGKTVNLSKEKYIRSNEKLKCITYSNYKFVLACGEKVLIINMNGRKLKGFVNNYYGEALFTNTSFVAVSPDNKYIYALEEDGTVTQLSFEAPLYKRRIGKSAKGITTDKHGNVFICERHPFTIHQTSAHLSGEKSAVTNFQPSLFQSSIAYLESNDTLIFGHDKSVTGLKLI